MYKHNSPTEGTPILQKSNQAGKLKHKMNFELSHKGFRIKKNIFFFKERNFKKKCLFAAHFKINNARECLIQAL